MDKAVAHYSILGKLGEGGMGVVYEAEATRLKRTVALKFPRRDASYSYRLAGDFSLLGSTGDSPDWLEKAVDRGFVNYPLLADKDQFLANIRGEERLRKLMERVKYEWEHLEVLEGEWP